jgi:hypothetical protein
MSLGNALGDSNPWRRGALKRFAQFNSFECDWDCAGFWDDLSGFRISLDIMTLPTTEN